MSQTLQVLKSQLKKARNSCYYGMYLESVSEFDKIKSKIESQIFHISDKDLLVEWNKLLEQIKYEKKLVQTTIEILSGGADIAVPIKGNPESEQYNMSNNNVKRRMSKDEPSQRKPRMPFGKKPFQKRSHEDDEVYNKKQKQKRYDQDEEMLRRQREQERQWARQHQRKNKDKNEDDDEVWDEIFPKQKPQPYHSKPVAKKNNNSSHPIYNANKLDKNSSSVENNNSKNRQYEKPWKKNAKVDKKGDKDKQEEKKTFLKACYPDGQGPDSNLIESMERQVVQTSPNISFDDIAELTKAKQILQQAVLLPLAMPDVFTGNRRAWKGVLLFGPPGTGKTLLAKAVASTGATTFFNVTASSLASKWRGQSEKMVRILFEMAKFYAPSTIFIDQIDSLASARGQKQDESSRRVKTQFMARIDGCTTGSTQQNHLITVIGATNRPWDLDEAIRRRLEKRIYIPLPTQLGRRQLLRINLKNEQTDQTLDFEQIVKQTEGYSGADIASLCRQAAYMPMRRKLKSQGGLAKKLKDVDWKEQFRKDVNIPLTMDDFKEALRNVKPSVGQSDLKNYMDWKEEFGEQGTN